MRLKSFHAKTMKEAMQMVRDELGEDAVIVATREEGDGRVRVTAALEQEETGFEDDYTNAFAFDGETEAVADDRSRDDRSRDEWLHYDADDEANVVVEQLTDIMLRHAVPEDILDQVVSCATIIGADRTDDALVASLEHLFGFRPFDDKRTGRILMLVGPPGAGKTLATAKLATRAVMAGQRVAVITTDGQRAGGVEQLAAFTKILRLDLKKADGPRQLAAAVTAAKGADRVLIDTTGVNAFNPADMKDLGALVEAGAIEPILVMPAGIDAEESGDIGRAYGAVGVRAMLPTRLDLTRRLGGILAAAHHGGLIFTDGSHTPKVADGLFAMTPKRLAALMLPPSRQTDTTAKAAPGTTKKHANAGL